MPLDLFVNNHLQEKMKKNTAFLIAVMHVTAVVLTSCATQSQEWKLVWTEDFKGKVIDESVWTRIGRGLSDWDNMMSLRPDLAYVENGELVLLGKVNDHSTADTTAFVTGGIWSAGKKSFQQARIEIRAKYNHVPGFWPALWLMPDAYLPAPLYAEIDIMEHINDDSIAYQTVHSRYTLDTPQDQQPPHSHSCPIRVGDWNTYATEIHPDSICFFVNDVKTFTYPRTEDDKLKFPWPDYPFYIILSNQLEGQWVGPVSNPELLPSELRVDWIKVYEK